MTFYQYLENLLGKPIKYYEMLMASKKEHLYFTEADVQKVKHALEPLKKPATAYFNLKELPTDDLAAIEIAIPKNKKGNPLPFYGAFSIGKYVAFLFIEPEKALLKGINYHLTVKKIGEIQSSALKKLEQLPKKSISSLPIWEEIIHRFPLIHKQIISLGRQHPWTLYKKAKGKKSDPEYQLITGGYPQWRVNDIDFRKLKTVVFLMEYRHQANSFSIYFFINTETKQIEIFDQKL